MQKPIAEMAKYIKNIIPANIPEVYPLKPMLKKIASEDSIRNGVLAFRNFLYLVCDRLIADGSIYDKPPKNTNNDVSHPSLAVSYPFLNNVKSVLFNMGYHGKLAENSASILLGDLQSLTSVISANGEQMKAKISVQKLIVTLRFLASCGIYFGGIDLDTGKPDMSKDASLEISYPDNPAMLIGLKVMAIAQKELYTKGNHDIFLRCDYRILKDEDTEVISILKDLVNPLPVEAQDFALKLHQRYSDAGMTCRVDVFYLGIRFIYSYKNKEIWTFSISLDSGYRILIRAQNTHLYADVIQKFPLPLQEKVAKGYGCEKKKYGKPCQKGCRGFSFSLDEEALELSQDIETWLDNEVACLCHCH